MKSIVMMTDDELNDMIASATAYAISRALEKYGEIPPIISRQEMIKQAGRLNVDRALKNGHLTPIKKGKRNSKVYCSRLEFDQYLLSTRKKFIDEEERKR